LAGYADHPPGAPVFGVRASLLADGVSLEGRFRYISNGDHSDFAARSPDEPFYVVWVACENHGFLAKSYRHHNGVNDIRRSSQAEQPPCFMRLALAKRNDLAPSQEAPELGLL